MLLVPCALALLAPAVASAFVTRGALGTAERANDVETVGTLAFVAEGPAGLRVVDVSDVESPQEIGSLGGLGDAVDVEVDGSVAYLADRDFGLRVIDVSDPTAPVEIASLAVLFLNDIELVGSLAFLAQGSPATGDSPVAPNVAALRIVDVSVPGAPAELGALSFLPGPGEPGGAPLDVAVSDGLVYVALSLLPDDEGFDEIGVAGVRVVDVSAPTTPTEVGRLDVGSGGVAVAVAEDHLYLVDASHALHSIDVSDPTSPAFAGPPLALQTGRDLGGDIALVGDVAYLALEDTGLQAVDLADPGALVALGVVGLPSPGGGGVEVVDGVVYLAAQEQGLRLVDGLPGFPRELSVLDDDSIYTDVEIVGSLAYATARDFGLRVYDLSQPAAPVEREDLRTPLDRCSPSTPGVTGVAVRGTRVYVSDCAGLVVLDVSSGTSAVRVGELSVAGIRVSELEVVGSLAVLRSRFGSQPGLTLVDVSDPTLPAVVGSFAESPVTALEVAGDRAFVIDEGAGVRVLDLSDPGAISQVGFFAFGGHADDLHLDGDLLHVLNDSTLRILDVSDPTDPVEIGSAELPGGGGRELVRLGDFVYAGAGRSTLVVDVSDPTAPVQRGGAAATAAAIAPLGRHLVIAQSQLRVWDFGPEFFEPDLDGDGDVDLDDLALTVAARNTPADGGSDPRDLDGDGEITVLDVRRQVLRCTRDRCAVEAGAEPSLSFADLARVLSGGEPAASAAPVPGPTLTGRLVLALGLAAWAGWAMTRRRPGTGGKRVKGLRVLVGVLALCGGAPLPSAAVSIGVVPSAPTVDVAGELEVALVASALGDGSAPSIGAFDLDLAWDPASLALVDATFGDPVLGDQLDLFGLGSLAGSTPATGSVNLFQVSLDAAADLEALQAESFVLATLTFTGLAPGASPLALTGIGVSDAAGAPLGAALESGAATVVPEPATALLVALGLVALRGAARSGRRRGVAPVAE